MNQNTDTTNATNKTAATQAKKQAAQAALMELVHEKIDLVSRPAWGGVAPTKTKIKEGELYYVSPSNLVVSNGIWDGDNGRLIHDSEGMADSIRRLNGVVEPLLAMINGHKAGEITLQQIIDGAVRPMVLKGNRRWEGATILEASTEDKEIVTGRIPVQFRFNLSAEEEAALRHDHGDRRGLTRPEVFKQIRNLRATTNLTQAQVGVRMFTAFYATAPEASKQKMDQVAVAFDNFKAQQRGETLPDGSPVMTETQAWEARKAWMRGPLQWGWALADLPLEVTKHVAYQMLPKLAQQEGIKVDWKPLKKEDAFELIKVKTEALALMDQLRKSGDLRRTLGVGDGESTVAAEKEFVLGKVLALFKEQIKSVAKSAGDGGAGDEDGEGGDTVDRAKSMSRQELVNLAGSQESTIMATILRGVAGQAEERRMFPEIDALLYKFELARKAQPELVARLLKDADALAACLK